ncbi:MAG: UDP-N-acetylmuramate--L-alanine ligase [Bacteroidetes bacterium]|nr:MAG: UDP-N-acetylmuramate--L-alanine ligase [Bacteroidota bacterium]
MSRKQEHIVFLGIGGIGMSAIARHYLNKGVPVFGYDKVRTKLTDELAEEGAIITYEDDAKDYPGWAAEHTTVIYTPAMPEDLGWLEFFNDFGMIKRAEALGLLANSARCLAIAGTHGKTSTSAMLLHILTVAGEDPTGFIGGIMSESGTNYRLGEGPWVVVEADEFDRSFMHLHPEAAAVTTVDADHLDIYGDAGELTRAFEAFVAQVSGPTFTGADIKPSESVLGTGAKVHAKDVRPANGAYEFTLVVDGTEHATSLKMPGAHNVYNATLAAALAQYAGVDGAKIAEALSSFKGIKRRFEFHCEEPVIIEDYAHHPTELEALLDSVDALYPEKNIVLVFQPHLYSRTRDFMSGFQAQLARATKTVLLPIYPAREAPIPGVTSAALAEKIPHAEVVEKDVLAGRVKALEPEVVLMVGAGDIGDLVGPLKAELT